MSNVKKVVNLLPLPAWLVRPVNAPRNQAPVLTEVRFETTRAPAPAPAPTPAVWPVLAALKLKRIVDIDDASIGVYWGDNQVLYGVPRNHPREYLNGKVIHSSAILRINGDEVETLNTVYKIKSWKKVTTAN